MDDLLWQVAMEQIHDDRQQGERAALANTFAQPEGGLVALWPLA